MKLKLCFLTPNQEKMMADQITKYSSSDRIALGVLVNGIRDLIQTLEFAYDNKNENTDHLASSFQILGHLIEPIQEYFNSTGGLDLENSPKKERKND